MTRTECEHRIAEHMESIIAILKEYNPESKYLSLSFCGSESETFYQFNNEYFGADAEHPVDFSKRTFRRWGRLFIRKCPVTDTYEIMVDGKPRYEHLAEDEFTEVMHQLLAERKE